MATWKAENSMLTQRGIEILNKLNLGGSKITITRIVAGSGRVSTSQLFSLTAVSGNQKQFVISKKEVKDSGSEISVYISNEDFTEPFTLQQIGVYVTHPDYEGEQLYHISQCEATGADVIPVVTETPTTFGYSLFLEHGNSSSIEITVSTQGMLREEDFVLFKGNISAGNLVEADEFGNLRDTGKKISEISNRNYLHNWYFANPVNRRDGYVVPPNTQYYKEPTLTTKVGTVSAYTKFNVIPGQNYGTITVGTVIYYVPKSVAVKGYYNTWEYTLDRWLNGGDGSLLIKSNGVEVKGAIDQLLSVNPEAGVYTCSALLSDGTLDTVTLEYDGVSEVQQVGHHIHFTIDPVSGFTDRPRFRLYPVGTKVVSAVKLEKGVISTLEQDIPADFATQAAICVQYDLITDEYIGLDFLRATGGTMSGSLILENYASHLIFDSDNGGAELDKNASGQMSLTNYLNSDKTLRRVFRIYGEDTSLDSCLKLAVLENGSWKHYNLYGEHNKQLISTVANVNATVTE